METAIIKIHNKKYKAQIEVDSIDQNITVHHLWLILKSGISIYLQKRFFQVTYNEADEWINQNPSYVDGLQ